MDSRNIALITGTSRGIGRALAERFLADGFRVVGCSRGEASALSADTGGDSVGVPVGDYEHASLDLTDEAAVQGWVKGVVRSHGRIDVVVNNAAEYAQAPALLTAASTLERLMRVNMIGSFCVSREAAKIMVRQKSGRIINMASMACGLHAEGASAYAASKSAVIEYSKVLAKEVAANNVTVNVVAPGVVETEMLDELGAEAKEAALQSLTQKRICTPGEVADIVAFLGSDQAACLTGQVLYMGLVV